MAVDHYENFPVASWLMPARLRPAVRAVYAFARSADDFADAGDEPPERRLARLAAYRAGLERIGAGLPAGDPVLARLQTVVRDYALPLAPFHDLLDAFSQDVSVKAYPTRAALLDYCRRSANPVGRIMLALCGHHDGGLRAASDAICTALQLINFLQDAAIDAEMGRIYLPGESLAAFGVAPAELLGLRPRQAAEPPLRVRELILAECRWARRLMLSGAGLPRALGGRFGLELGLVVAGGLRILSRIEAVEGDVARRRPRLAGLDWPALGWHAWVRGFPPSGAS